MTLNDLTGKLRIGGAVLFALVVLAGLVGWLFFDRDPNQLLGLVGPLTAVIGIGEASNVGKRATYNPEAR